MRRRVETIERGDLARLAAVFDRDPPAVVPPAWHWACLKDAPLQSSLSADGHPVRGDFLPDIAAPRRMFAAADMTFWAPLAVGAATELVEQIAGVEEKAGRAGAMTFVTVERRLSQGGVLAVTERQTLVYRGGETGTGAGAPIDEASEWRVKITPDPTVLFRFSAATFNAHRIHYDRPYATEVEGYPGLVVHGPLTALLLLEALAGAHPGKAPRTFSFRARAPLFDTAPFHVCGRLDDGGASLWAEAPDGTAAMTAKVQF